MHARCRWSWWDVGSAWQRVAIQLLRTVVRLMLLFLFSGCWHAPVVPSRLDVGALSVSPPLRVVEESDVNDRVCGRGVVSTRPFFPRAHSHSKQTVFLRPLSFVGGGERNSYNRPSSALSETPHYSRCCLEWTEYAGLAR